MKKSLHIIFIFYLITLALVPCVDSASFSDLNCEKVQQAENGNQHDEICTPFCVCSCCSSQVVMNSFPKVISGIALTLPDYIIQKDSKISSAIISIWQPPKLA